LLKPLKPSISQPIYGAPIKSSVHESLLKYNIMPLRIGNKVYLIHMRRRQLSHLQILHRRWKPTIRKICSEWRKSGREWLAGVFSF